METIRKLSHTEMLETSGWIQVAQKMIDGEWQLGRSLQIVGIGLADAVTEGEVSLEYLKSGVGKANTLDAEAYQTNKDINGSGFCLDDQIEAYARRLAHHSGRSALNLVRTEFDRFTYLSRRKEIIKDSSGKLLTFISRIE